MYAGPSVILGRAYPILAKLDRKCPSSDRLRMVSFQKCTTFWGAMVSVKRLIEKKQWNIKKRQFGTRYVKETSVGMHQRAYPQQMS